MKALLPVLSASLLAFPSHLHAGVWAHYPFDTDYSDASGNGRHGTLTDVGTLGNSGIVSTTGDLKFGAGAMRFSTERDFIGIPAKSFGSGTPYSIAFWARKSSGDTSDAAQWDMVIGQRENVNHFIALGDSTGTGFRWRGNSNTTDRQTDFGVTKDYAWHHYVFVASGTTVALYVDGQLFGSATGKLTGFNIDTIGEAYPASNDFDFNGDIDEVWIFDEAIDATKVGHLYQSNNLGLPFPGFHLSFDGNLNDSGTGAFHATPSGTAAVTTDPARIVVGSGALAMEGTDTGFITLPTTGSYTATQPWTAMWWARREGIGTGKGMVMGTPDTSSDFIWLNDSIDGLRFRSSDATTLDFTVSKDSELHHYALVADGAGNLTLHVDGQQTQTLTGNTSFAVSTIGKAYPTTALHYNFNGTLDEVRLLPTAMTATQVTDIYNAEKPDTPVSAATKLHVILLAGQSNADGRASVSGLPTTLQSAQTDVDFYYRVEGGSGTLTTLTPGLSESGQFGPEITLGRRLADLHVDETGTRVAIIKYANGGTNLHTQWKAGGNATTAGDGTEYITFQQTVSSGLAALAVRHPLATIQIDSMVWMQGESDASSGPASSYQANLTAFISDVRDTYGATLPFVIGRLSSEQTSIDPAFLATIRAAQDAVAAANPWTAVTSTDGFGMNADALHFSASGQQSLGSAFAVETAFYSWMNATFSTGDITAGLAEPWADADGDGQTNFNEFVGRTNPLSGTSLFKATLVRSDSSTVSVTYPSTPSRLYAVERWIEASNTWENAAPFTAGTQGSTTRTVAASAERAIYRVISKMP